MPPNPARAWPAHVAAALLCLPAAAQAPVDDGTPNLPDTIPAFAGQTEAPEQRSGVVLAEEVVTGALATPWAVAVLPDGAGYLVTERGGSLRHVSRDGTIGPGIDGVPDVRAIQQGGLLDVALAPDFAESRVIYLTYSSPSGLAASATAAARAVLSPDHAALSEVVEIFRQTPASSVPAHFGSRIVPLPDGNLAITTGDRFTPRNRVLAQRPSTTYGVVVQITPEGDPAGAPIAPDALPEVLSFGHRNLQGAAVHPGTGALWTLEHGPAGGDELNLIARGGNYGWPVVSYGVNYNGSDVGSGLQAHAPAFVEPRYYWDPSIAPSDLVFYDGAMFPDWQGDILAAGLVAQAVVRLVLDGDTVTAEERLAEGVGRVRDVAVDHDGSILFLTDEGGASRLMRLSR